MYVDIVKTQKDRCQRFCVYVYLLFNYDAMTRLTAWLFLPLFAIVILTLSAIWYLQWYPWFKEKLLDLTLTMEDIFDGDQV